MPDSTSQKINRRDFFALAWKGLLTLSGALGLAGLWRFLSYQPNPAPPTLFDLGPLNNLATDVIITVPEAQAALLPTEQGYKAVSLVCPHLGCLVEAKKDGFICPCHGSEFNLDGTLRKGPADQPLTPLQLEITEDGHWILDTSEG